MVIKNQNKTIKEKEKLNKRIKDFNKNNFDNENVKNLPEKYKKIWEEVQECREEIEYILRSMPTVINKDSWDKDMDFVVAAYLLARAGEFNDPFSYKPSGDKDLDKDILAAYEATEINKYWDELLELVKKYDINIFKLVSKLNNFSSSLITPEGIGILAEEILDIKEQESFSDLCCGAGSIIRAICSSSKCKHAYGFDIDQSAIAMAKIYGEGSDIHFERKDIFTLVTDSTDKVTYDKIFCNFPFGEKLINLKKGKEFLSLLEKKVPSISKATSSDWLYNALITELLSDEGKAVSIVTNGSTWNMIDAPIRKYFIEKGLIEAVIELPARMFSNTIVATSLVVFSHNNKGVRLIDATNQFKAGRRLNELADENIDYILDLIQKDCEESIFIDVDTMRDNDYVLNMSRYKRVDNIENGRPFGEVISRITRGSSIKASDLDKMSTNEPTNMQYLMLANIQNGIIDTELPYLKEIDAKNKRYCLKDRCLILSKNGYPYKVAIAEVKEGQEILANGNLYIIELDEEIVDPYYIAAYLGSEQGTAALKSITVGAILPNVGVEQLRKLVIPVPDMEVQKKIANKYKELKDEIKLLRLKIERANNELASIIEEGGI